MISIQSKVHVDGIGSGPRSDFLLSPNDRDYQRWWRGTHLVYHTLRQGPAHIGDVVYMDEYVGKRRIRMTGIVTEADPGKKITWQMLYWIRLPVWLSIELEEVMGGVSITHTISAGFNDVGRLLDGLFRFYFSDGFARAMDDHVRTEFPRLGKMLSSRV